VGDDILLYRSQSSVPPHRLDRGAFESLGSVRQVRWRIQRLCPATVWTRKGGFGWSATCGTPRFALDMSCNLLRQVRCIRLDTDLRTGFALSELLGTKAYECKAGEILRREDYDASFSSRLLTDISVSVSTPAPAAAPGSDWSFEVALTNRSDRPLRILDFASSLKARYDYCRLGVYRPGQQGGGQPQPYQSAPLPPQALEYTELAAGQQYRFRHSGLPYQLPSLAPGDYEFNFLLFPTGSKLHALQTPRVALRIDAALRQ